MRPSVCHPARRRYGQDLPSLFNVFFDNLSSAQHTNAQVNIAETAAAFEVEVALPGMTKEDFRVKVENDMLTIWVEKSSENGSTANPDAANSAADNGRRYIRREFNYTAFKRSFTLPDNVDATAIKAQYNNGILTVVLPKKNAPAQEAKNIEIN